MTLAPRSRRAFSDRRVVGMLAAITLVKGIFWIALFPVFKIADEPGHFENIQYRGEHFAAPRQNNTEPFGTTVHVGSPPDVALAWERSNHLFRGRYVEGVRSLHDEQVLRDMASDPATRRGSGQLTSANYPAFYYNVAVPVYEVFRRVSVLTRVAAIRCVSLMFGILAVVATFLTGRLVMRSRALAVAAALVVMLQPMESQMAAAVNNDAGIIGLAGVLFYLQVRFLVRAPEIPRLRWGIAMAILSGCIVFTKPQGFAMLPGCAFACAWVVAQNLRDRRAWIFAGVTAAITGAFVLASMVHMAHTGQAAVMASNDSAPPSPLGSPGFWAFLGTVDEGYRLYLFRSFFGQFGWLEYSLPGYWLDSIRLIWNMLLAGTLAAIVLKMARQPGSKWLSMRAFLFSWGTALFALGFVLFVEYRFRRLGIMGVIQGRNLLFALPALAIVTAASYGALVPARFRSMSAAALAISAVALHIGAVIYIFRYHYGT